MIHQSIPQSHQRAWFQIIMVLLGLVAASIHAGQRTTALTPPQQQSAKAQLWYDHAQPVLEGSTRASSRARFSA